MQVKEQIRQFIRESFVYDQIDNLPDDASFLEHGIVDSTGVLELVLFVEDTFGIEVDDDDVVPANFDSVAALAAYVARKGGPQS
jgi:acyl carrier protein